MTWNYRVLEFIDPDTEEVWQAIHEVHYDSAGNPVAYTEDAAAVMTSDDAGNLADLGWVLDRMREALAKPALRETDFPQRRYATS